VIINVEVKTLELVGVIYWEIAFLLKTTIVLQN